MAVRLNRLFRKEVVILVPVLTWALLLRNTEPHPVYFESISEFRAFAAKNHLLLQPSGMADAGDNFYVSDHAVTLEHLLSLTKKDCGLSAAWRGIIWVHGHSRLSYVAAGSIGGHCRIWGNLLVAGDQALLERVEEIHRADT
jgi:hypothetical protein